MKPPMMTAYKPAAAPAKVPHVPTPHVPHAPQVPGAGANFMGKEAAQSRQLNTLNLDHNTGEEDSASMTSRIANTLLSRLQSRDKK